MGNESLQGCSKTLWIVYKISKLSNIIDAHSVVVVSAGFHSRVTQFLSRGRLVFDSRFTKFVLRSSGSIKLRCSFRTPTLASRVQLPLE